MPLLEAHKQNIYSFFVLLFFLNKLRYNTYQNLSREQNCSLLNRNKDRGKEKSYGHFVISTLYMNAYITGFSYAGQ